MRVEEHDYCMIIGFSLKNEQEILANENTKQIYFPAHLPAL
jgi:hypothetical protein